MADVQVRLDDKDEWHIFYVINLAELKNAGISVNHFKEQKIQLFFTF